MTPGCALTETPMAECSPKGDSGTGGLPAKPQVHLAPNLHKATGIVVVALRSHIYHSVHSMIATPGCLVESGGPSAPENSSGSSSTKTFWPDERHEAPDMVSRGTGLPPKGSRGSRARRRFSRSWTGLGPYPGSGTVVVEGDGPVLSVRSPFVAIEVAGVGPAASPGGAPHRLRHWAF